MNSEDELDTFKKNNKKDLNGLSNNLQLEEDE